MPVPSARIACEIQCRLTAGDRAIGEHQLQHAADVLVEIEDFLHRGIECGALADLWSILGFQGQFSLFPSPENSVPDHRIDQLIELMEQIMALYARLWSEAAASQQRTLTESLSRGMQKLTQWWDQFAPTSVEGIESFSGAEAFDSAREVAAALADFRQADAAAGDINFWRQRVAHFNSPKAYALVVRALFEKPDLVAAMALLMQWLSQASTIPLKQGEYSFHALALRWLAEVFVAEGREDQSELAAQNGESLVRRYFELLEANAEDFWQVPDLDLLGGAPVDSGASDSDDEEQEDGEEADSEGGLYSAAYDDVVFVDSTSDGVDADMLESGGPATTDFELDIEAQRVSDRLAFLRTVASLWKSAAAPRGPGLGAWVPHDVLEQWLAQALTNEKQLVKLSASVDARRIPAPSASRESLLEFDRRRSVKETLVEKIVVTAVETTGAARGVRAALSATGRGVGPDGDVIDQLLAAVVQADAQGVRQLWPAFLEFVKAKPILYVPLSKGGDPTRLAQVRHVATYAARFAVVVASAGTAARSVPAHRSLAHHGIREPGRRRSDQRIRPTVQHGLRVDRGIAGRSVEPLVGRSGESGHVAGRSARTCDRSLVATMAGPQSHAAAQRAGAHQQRQSVAGPGLVHRTVRPRSVHPAVPALGESARYRTKVWTPGWRS